MAEARIGEAGRPAAGAAGGSAAPGAPPPRASWRHSNALAVALVVLAIACAVRVALAFRPPVTPVELGVHVRADVSGVPVYTTPTGEDRIHLLRPGTVVNIEGVLKPTARYYGFAVLDDGLRIQGWVKATDLVTEDLDRAKQTAASRGN